MTCILLTSAWKRNHLNSTSQHHRNIELFYHPHVFSVQTFGHMSKNHCCTLKTSQTKLHCPGWIWPLHRCKVVRALENTSKPNDMMNMENRNMCFTYATKSFPCTESQTSLEKPWRFFWPRVSNTPSISVGTKDSSPAKQCEENSSPSLRILWTNATQMNAHSNALKTRQLYNIT